ncbi:HAMP domain-containing sensor histidine kinase [Myxosarcina sp. GI1]|uniref:sensor histidine kinase n=1 Tax=Myxosarcina sp. GI1 TaxID=1541065 RepID=UPI000564336A|nr:HAMP domain-containing sensor histidine kinase [Myxosarcina sp. GI1]
MDVESILTAKTNKIIEQWLESLKQEREIESTSGLSNQSLQDSIPAILKAIAKNVADGNTKIENLSKQKADIHGVLRAKQNFNPEEVAREFFLLRQIAIAELKPELIQCSPVEIVNIITSIDVSLDHLVSQSFKTYMEQKLKQLGQLQHQLLLTNQELTRLVDAHQDNFSYLTHEMKTPLTSILGYSDLFLRQSQQDKLNNESTANLRHIEEVLTQGRKLLRIISDNLELASYQSEKPNLNCEVVEVCSLINNTLLTLKPLADRRKLKLIVACQPRTLEFVTDSLRLQQILINLVTNAIRYTESGKIEVICQMSEKISDRLKIEIADTGIGIAPEYQSCIFEPYFRVNPQQNYNSESRGLGLAIVKQLVKMLQGEISVNSKLGVGSTFTVVLPKLERSLAGDRN